MPITVLGIKERQKYRDIEWLMPSVDVLDVLPRLGVEGITIQGNEVRAKCPDHHIYVGRESSDPNWFLNMETGQTICFTEGRGSNLVWITARLLDCHPKEAVKWLMGTDAEVSDATLDIARRGKLRRRLAPSRFSEHGVEGEQRPTVAGLSAIQRDMDARYMSDAAYQFFIHPPGKAPTNIRKETVDHYKVFERTWGTYTNRVLIPFVVKGELMGFCAIDILGKEQWLARHPDKSEEEYKKVRYPANFHSSACLFGFDDCEKGCDDLFITEGAREVMKLRQEGFPNAVAILGSHLGDGQYQLICELAPKRIILLFDGDDAGRLIADRVTEGLRRNYSGDSLIRCNVPEGRDPKNLIGKDFAALVAAA